MLHVYKTNGCALSNVLLENVWKIVNSQVHNAHNELINPLWNMIIEMGSHILTCHMRKLKRKEVSQPWSQRRTSALDVNPALPHALSQLLLALLEDWVFIDSGLSLLSAKKFELQAYTSIKCVWVCWNNSDVYKLWNCHKTLSRENIYWSKNLFYFSLCICLCANG